MPWRLERLGRFLGSLLLVFFLFGCSKGGLFNTKNAVTVEKVIVEEKPNEITIQATLEPSAKISFQFPVEVKVEKLMVELGQKVVQTEPLLSLNETDFNLKLTKLKNQLLEKEASLEKNSYFLQHRERLLEEGKIDQSLYDTLEPETKKIQAESEQIKTEIALLEEQVKQTTLTAPFDGIITAINAASGISIPEQKPLLTLVKTDPMFVSFKLPADEALGVRVGLPLRIQIEEFVGQELSADISFIHPELDSGNRTFEVKASLKNPNNNYKAGMSAEIHFTSERQIKTLNVPTQSIVKEGDREYVFIVKENKAWPTRIYTKQNPNSPELTEVMEGLKEGDLVVVQGQENLKAGMEVNLWR